MKTSKNLCFSLLAKLTVVFLMVSFFISPISLVFAQTTSTTTNTSIPSPSTPTPSTTIPTDNSSTTTTSTATTDSSTPVVIAPTTTDSSPTPAPAQTTITPQTPSTPSVTPVTPSVDNSPTTPDNTQAITPATNNLSTTNKAQAQLSSIPVDNASSIIQNSTESHNLIPTPDPSTGAMIYNYAIKVPPGRNGMQPDLKLAYNSQNITEDNYAGFGWTTNIPYISRLNKEGVSKLYSSSFSDWYFNSSLDGQLVLASTSGTQYTYIARVETGGFNSYVLNTSTNTWTLTTKTGMVYVFGSSTASREDNPNNAAQIAKWFVNTQTDPNGNYISYSYIKDQGEIYPSNITYTNSGSTTGIYQVNFTYQTRPDVSYSYTYGFLVTTAKSLSQIQTTDNGAWVEQYALTYSASPDSGRSLLNTITESAKSILGVITTFPPTTMTYQQDTAGLTAQSSNWTLPTINSTCCQNGSSYNTTITLGPSGDAKIIDVNGDGLPDIVYSKGFISPSTGDPGAEVYLNNGSGWTLDTNWSFPVFSNNNGIETTFNLQNNTVRFVDVNSDGLMDAIVDDDQGTIGPDTGVYLNTGSGWTKSSTWQLPTIYSSSGTNYTIDFTQIIDSQDDVGNPVRFIDVNGDGRPDIVYATGCAGSTCGAEESTVAINTGSGWYIDPNWQLPTISNATAPYNVSNFAMDNSPAQLIDVNGDGLPDIVDSTAYVANSCGFSQGGYFRNTGDGWIFDPCWDHTNFPTYSSQLVDMNNDGLPDIITAPGVYSSSTPMVDLNTGTGWTATTNWGMLSLGTSSNCNLTFNFLTVGVSCGIPDIDGSTRIVDFSGDNLPDLNQGQGVTGSQGEGIYFNSNSSLVPEPSVSAGGYFSTTNGDATQAYDLNNDGLPDYIYLVPNSSCLYNVSNCPNGSQVYINSGSKADILSSVTVPDGAQTSVTYKQIPIQNFATPTEGYSIPVYVVSQVSTNDGNGVINTTNYAYSGGTFYSGAPTDRGFSGFSKIITTDSQGNVTNTYYHTGMGTDSTHGEYQDNYWKIGEPYRVEQYDSSGHLYAKTINKWDDTVSSANPLSAFVKLDQTVSYTYDGQSTHKDKAISYTYDANGNVTQEINYGIVTGNDDGTFTDTGTDLSTTTYTYATKTGTNEFLVSDKMVKDQSSNKVSDNQYYYDSLPGGQFTLGNLTEEQDWITGVTYGHIMKAYNSYGLATSSTDPNGHVTSYAYDTYDLYPATMTDPLNHVTSYTYDYNVGKVATKTDPNNSVWSTSYDGAGRIIQQNIPDPSGGPSPVTQAMYTYTDTANAVSVEESDYLSSSNIINTYKYFDGLDRLIQERVTAPTSGNYNVTDTVYNTLGLVLKQSLPYTGTGTAKTSPTTTLTLYENYTYDPMQRVLTDSNAVGTTSYAYNLWKTTVMNPNGKQKNYYKDAYDNLIQVDEISSGSTYSTYYTWNLNKDLTNITDALGNVRNFTYDALNRELTAQDLHASADTTYGTWTYVYDKASNLTQSVSPLNKTVNYTYDSNNRVLTEAYTGDTGTDITYAYDTCTDGIGRLCTATLLNGTVSAYTYNAVGNLASDKKTINTVAYTTSYISDRQGNKLIITYPDNSEVRYTYNGAGLLGEVDQEESGGTFAPVVSGFNYSPMNQVTAENFANGVITTNTYDATHVYRLTNKSSVLGSTYLQNLSYTYDNVGNITQLVDASNTNTSKTVNYTYDDLNRLTQAVATGQTAYTQNFAYNAIGDITSGPAGSYTYAGNTGTSYANPDAVTNLTPSTNTNPVITLNGSNLINLTVGNSWVEPGYSATDAKDGNITSSVVVTGSVNTAIAGTYQLIYSVVDSSGVPSARMIRTVVVGTSNVMRVQALVVGGGGAGGFNYNGPGGGGGAGGYLYDATHSIKSQAYPIVVGAGAIGVNYGTNPSGNNSSFDTMTAIGGGGGGSDSYSPNGASGGSGGGGAQYGSYPGGSGTVGQGNAGGAGSGSIAGAGGGASAAGTGSNTGGAGISNSISGSAVVYAVGGGGGGPKYGSNGISGAGYGGGGYGNAVTPYYGGNGNNGVVIIAYHTDGSDGISPASTGGTITTSGVYTIHTFTSSGTFTANSNIINPVISLTGSTLIKKNVGDTWTEPGYSATDAKDGNITSSVVVTGSVNTAIAGTYQLVYNVINSQGAPAAGVIRTIVVTNPNGINPTYDNDGNVLTDGVLTNTWNYKNQLTKTTNGTFIDNYIYDENGNRVSSSNGTITTVYPNIYYTYDGTTKTRDIYAGSTLVATITNVGGTIIPYYVNTDALGSTNVITNSSGMQQALLDYFPYGNTRISSGSYTDKKQYIGQEYDTDTSLNYLNARYYQSSSGRFISEDPVFWSPEGFLNDPQQLNSYSYARNNPITLSDPTGKWFGEFLSGHQSWDSFSGEVGNATLYMGGGWQTAMDHPYVPAMVGAAPLAVYGAVVAAPYVATAASALASNPATGPAILRGTLGAAANMSAKALDNEITGNSSTAGSYAFAGITGFAGGILGGEGIGRSALIGAGVNTLGQIQEKGTNISYPSIGISALSSIITGGILSNVPPNATSTAGKIITESVVNWITETPLQTMHSGLTNTKK